MNKTDLITGYSLFGGKGDVFSGTAHICKDGLNPNTLCGKPMLSTNWVQIYGVNNVGCSVCIDEYVSLLTEQQKRDIYIKAFGHEFDSPNRKQLALPIDLAAKVAFHMLSREQKEMKNFGTITEKELEAEYFKLCLLYPNGMKAMFKSGLNEYIESRTIGNYSVDAIVQNFKND